MYRVMIVDDEPAIRKGLLSFIPWQSLDCEVAFTASDGKEAIENIALSNPDIIITDVKMPEMDGIELSKRLHFDYPQKKVIILTAYSDFEYSQSAIKYDVVDFVLKPTSMDKLMEAIEKAKFKIKKDRENANKIEKLEKEILDNKEEMQYGFLLKVINRIINDEYIIMQKALALDINIEDFFAIVINIKDGHFQRKDVLNINSLLSRVFEGYNCYILGVNNKSICAFINVDGEEYLLDSQKLIDICIEVTEIMSDFAGFDISIGISSLKNGIAYVSEAYEEGNLAIQNKLCVEKNIFMYTDKYCSDSSTDYVDAILTKVNTYIEDNYNKKLNLAGIAEYVHLNSSYLSRLYKEETGVTITEKITRTRINKGKELLKKTDLKIYEISYMIGFDNPNYFSTVFKRYTSVYPKEYRVLNE